MNTNYSSNNKSDSKYQVKEQLRLYAFDTDVITQPEVFSQFRHELSNREILATLLQGELNFHGENSRYATHDVHAFAAKFPPQLPRAFIRGLSKPGDIVLDPMMGSGTTVVEALLEGRKGIGFDLDPLALRLSSVKTTPLYSSSLRETGYKVISNALKLLETPDVLDSESNKRFDQKTKEFIDYWFFPSTQKELLSLAISIREIQDTLTRRFFELTFSSIIVTKSGGVSRARDLAHSRPHLDKQKIPKNAIDQFSIRLNKNLNSVSQIQSNGQKVRIIESDARYMPVEDGSIDLIVTSPPYANAIDYMRAHKFSLVWFGEQIDSLSELRSKYIGSERIGKPGYSQLPESVNSIINQLNEQDKKKALILRKYFIEMKQVIEEMYRVLKKGSVSVIVIGTSIMRGLDISTHQCLSDIAMESQFDVVGIAKRQLDRNKRMMPTRFQKNRDSTIEQRMHEEYVLGLIKP